jgi:N-acetylglutamate synthase-like GNAT family acetyltransferase
MENICQRQVFHDKLRRYAKMETIIHSGEKTVIVRPAESRDLEGMAQLYASSFPEHIMVHRGILTNPSYLGEQIKSPDQRWNVAELNGEIVGVAALAIARPVGLGEIERVCVGLPFRGNGVSSGLCGSLVDAAKEEELGFVEAFARGNQPAMQRTFEKLGFIVYGVAPRFEIIHDGADGKKKVVREQFVHMGLELKPETVDEEEMDLIASAQDVFDEIHQHKEDPDWATNPDGSIYCTRF